MYDLCSGALLVIAVWGSEGKDGKGVAIGLAGGAPQIELAPWHSSSLDMNSFVEINRHFNRKVWELNCPWLLQFQSKTLRRIDLCTPVQKSSRICTLN
jgi:hypothetical protein